MGLVTQRMHESVEAFWDEFLHSGQAAEAAGGATYVSWHFGTGGQMANELVELVLDGRKRATAGALWSYEHDGDDLPRVGDYAVVTDGSDVPRCVIRTTEVAVVPFSEVSEEFAASEGEGDGSLAHWREGHWRFFTMDLAQFGRVPEADMPVVCERFELVYPIADRAEAGAP